MVWGGMAKFKCGGRVGLAEERPSARVRWWRERMLLLAMLQQLMSTVEEGVCQVSWCWSGAGGSIHFEFV